MIKTAILTGAALGMIHGIATPAFAGPYVNGEVNTSFSDGTYRSSLLETHVGYSGELSDTSSWYIQGGPAIDFGAEETVETLSGKVGVSTELSSNLVGYGEVSAMGADDFTLSDLNVGVKAGLTYSF